MSTMKYAVLISCFMSLGLSAPIERQKMYNHVEMYPSYKEECRPTVYFTSPLYNAGESVLNMDLVSIMEASFNVDVLLPQRDGFDFQQLFKALATVLHGSTEQELIKATKLCVFFLNVGVFLENADVVLAHLDEPRDSRITVETVYANMIDIPVAIWRSDSRTPFGSAQDELQGAPLYPILNAETYTYRFISASRTSDAATKELWGLAQALALSCKTAMRDGQCNKPLAAFAKQIPFVQLISKAAHLLFGTWDIKTIVRKIHTQDGLINVAKAYAKFRIELESIYPSIL